MKQDQEKKIVTCKVCKLTFVDGRCLGGHMRSHFDRSKSGSGSVSTLESDSIGDGGNGCCSGGGGEGYGLRENPKKSWKSSASERLWLERDNDGCCSSSYAQERVQCRVCGKEFESSMSLNGHLRHHSKQERKRGRPKRCDTGYPNSISRPNLAASALSDPDPVCFVRRRKRSRRMRSRFALNHSFCGVNEPETYFEIDDDAREGAMALIMLSRGWPESGGSTLRVESFDCSFLAPKPNFLGRSESESGDYVFDVNESDDLKKSRYEKLDSEDEKFECGECDSEKVSGGKNVDRLCCVFDSKRKKLEGESGFGFCDIEMEKRTYDELNQNPGEAELFEELMEEFMVDVAGSNPTESCDLKSENYTCNKVQCSDSVDNYLNRSEFRCKTCNKLLPSYQSLGGHQTIHRRNKASSASKSEDHENHIQTICSPETEFTGKPPLLDLEIEHETTSISEPSSKEHKCEICLKVFATGYALGGHKRTHYGKPKQEQASTATVQEVPVMFNGFSIDLNKPEVDPDIELKPFWAGSGHRHGPLLGLVAN